MRARHPIARREIAGRIVARHERLAGGVDAAARLRRAAPPTAGTAAAPARQRGRMKLHELEVRDARAGAIRHRHAVAGRDRGIGRVAIDLTGAAGRQQHDAGARRPDACRPPAGSARRCSGRRSTISSTAARVSVRARRRGSADTRPTAPADLAAGRVARVQHAPDAVRPFDRQRRRARRRRDRTPRPSRSARARSAGRLRPARAPRARRTGRRRRRACRRRAAPASRRRRPRPRCRPARSRCCPRAAPPW